MTLPNFVAPGDYYYSLPLKPPFYFENMTVRVFPLRARISAIQNFVDHYLNIIPKELGWFRAFLPYAHLMMIDYGKLANQVTNLGWFAQREIMFAVPVEWYRFIRGRWVFHDWAWTTPFIFVDSKMSLTLGRAVYGWPKLLAQMVPTEALWMQDPTVPMIMARASTKVFSELYAGQTEVERPVLEIRRRGPTSALQIPPNLENPFAPWAVATNVVGAMAQLTRDSLSLLGGLGIMPTLFASGPDNYARMAQRAASMTNPYKPNLSTNTLNLKQFRECHQPKDFCYQSLTCAPMTLAGFNRGGLLGDMSVLAGDMSGGYSLYLARWPSLPILETLGLEVADQWRGDGVDIAELKPVLPFWYDVNMKYERGSNVAWRTHDRVWRDQEGHAYRSKDGRDDPADRQYNTTLGASLQTVAGPFVFADTVLRVLPLLADKRKLQSFLDVYLNEALGSAGVRFELWCPPDPKDPYAYVYLFAMSYGDVTSESDNIGAWASQEATFFIPVQWWQGDRLGGLGVVPAFSYADSTTAVISTSEVLGIATTKASFVSPPNTWMSNWPSAKPGTSLLAVGTEVLPVLGLGQKASDAVILEICTGEVLDERQDPARWRQVTDHLGVALREELQRKKRTKAKDEELFGRARILALELLANEGAWNVFTLKQFRDVHEPDHACYQSISRVPCQIHQLEEIREIETPIHVRIREYPSQGIVTLLGLTATLADCQDGGATYLLRPVRPFWLKMAWKQGLGERLWHRSGSETWEDGPPEKEKRYFDGNPPRPLRIPNTLNDFINEGEPRRLKSVVKERLDAGDPLIKLREVEKIVKAIDPQMIIETILSREWENWDENARWCGRRSEEADKLAARLAGAKSGERAGEEQAHFRELLADYKAQRYSQEAINSLGQRVEILNIFMKILEDIDSGHPIHEDMENLGKKIWINDYSKGPFATAVVRLLQLDDWTQKALAESEDKDSELPSELDRARKILPSLRSLYSAQRDAVLAALSKMSQKPDFCVPRSCVGPEKDRFFPRDESWDDAWYVGPEPKQEPKRGQPAAGEDEKSDSGRG